MDTNKAILSFNPNDFFYYNAELTPTDNECKSLLNNTIQNCNDMNIFLSNSDKCIKHKLCDNKQKSQTIFQTQTSSENDIRLNDMNEIYNIEKINCINYSLGIGIISMLILNKIFIYFKP